MHKHDPLLVRCSHSALRVLVPVIAAVHRSGLWGGPQSMRRAGRRGGATLDFALLAWHSGWCMLDTLRVGVQVSGGEAERGQRDRLSGSRRKCFLNCSCETRDGGRWLQQDDRAMAVKVLHNYATL